MVIGKGCYERGSELQSASPWILRFSIVANGRRSISDIPNLAANLWNLWPPLATATLLSSSASLAIHALKLSLPGSYSVDCAP